MKTITSEDIIYAESMRTAKDNFKKINSIKLQKLLQIINPKWERVCMCSESYRKDFIKVFFGFWDTYLEQKNTNE